MEMADIPLYIHNMSTNNNPPLPASKKKLSSASITLGSLQEELEDSRGADGLLSPPGNNHNLLTVGGDTPPLNRGRRRSWQVGMKKRRPHSQVTPPRIDLTAPDDDPPPFSYDRTHKRHSWWSIFVPDNIGTRGRKKAAMRVGDNLLKLTYHSEQKCANSLVYDWPLSTTGRNSVPTPALKMRSDKKFALTVQPKITYREFIVDFTDVKSAIKIVFEPTNLGASLQQSCDKPSGHRLRSQGRRQEHVSALGRRERLSVFNSPMFLITESLRIHNVIATIYCVCQKVTTNNVTDRTTIPYGEGEGLSRDVLEGSMGGEEEVAALGRDRRGNG
ncbi:hypothetical protein AAG570_000054 [Ranatra chinensis]|uniref:Uncharacterized protein n=1 Tax=Ranatra chinensis TaxID=642074 RepID=A0ABD0Z8L7_9HEMI